ncbi:MAG: 6-phosphogluconolactonase [Mesorhizobium sp.]
MAANYRWNEFADRGTLAPALAGRIAQVLAGAVARRGRALMAVSGGTTPKMLFQALSRHRLAWDKVVVTLVDERFVPASSPRSNAALVAENLLQNEAAAARFVPLYREGPTLEAAAQADSADMKLLPWPLDVALLGMGTDGHTASFFPDADNLEALLEPGSDRTVLPVHAPSAGEPRLTLVAARILEAGFLALHIEGDYKRAAFEAAMGQKPGAGAQKPIATVIRQSPKPVEVFWAP